MGEGDETSPIRQGLTGDVVSVGAEWVAQRGGRDESTLARTPQTARGPH